jgi:arabinose-5-phosphate isomerase
MLVLGDALAVALMERRGFSADQYRDFHPGGSLGKKLIRVSDIMHKDAPLVAEDASMKNVLIAMTAASQGFAGVVGVVDRKGALVGIVTDGDLRRHMERSLLDRTARDVMSRNPKTVAPSLLAAEALAMMNEKGISRLFVVDAGDKSKKPLGIIHLYDCIRAGLT